MPTEVFSHVVVVMFRNQWNSFGNLVKKIYTLAHSQASVAICRAVASLTTLYTDEGYHPLARDFLTPWGYRKKCSVHGTAFLARSPNTAAC